MFVNRKLRFGLFSLVVLALFAGWGGTGHSIISKNAATLFPASMQNFKTMGDYITAHCSDPDTRKSADKTEGPKHYIDIDYYPEFVANHTITQSLDSLTTKYGSSVVTSQGTLPYWIVISFDSLRNAFARKDYTRANVFASDIGHYVGDEHQPLHVTQNYDGGMTNQSGIHSRYETTLVGAYQAQLVYTNPTPEYVSNVADYVFNATYKTFGYVDSVLRADSITKAVTGSTSGSAYTTSMWNMTGSFTINLMKEASFKTASLIYTAWKDAGSPDATVTDVTESDKHTSPNFKLSAYPNPFNGQITFSFTAPADYSSNTSIIIYNVYGAEIDIIPGNNISGNSSVRYNASKLSSGVYFATLRSGGKAVSSMKFVAMK